MPSSNAASTDWMDTLEVASSFCYALGSITVACLLAIFGIRTAGVIRGIATNLFVRRALVS